MDNSMVSLTELKQRLGEFIRRAAYGGERIILLSHGKASAALVSMEDLRLLEQIGKTTERQSYIQQQEKLLEEARVLRERIAADGYQVSTLDLLDEVREERTDDLLGLH
jgi:prevent-host-death family protein